MKAKLLQIAENISDSVEELKKIVAETPEPVKPQSKYSPGQYWWSGKREAGKSAEHKPCKVTILHVSNQVYQITTNGVDRIIVSESELSPIPVSKHQPGERFNDEYIYKGVIDVPPKGVPYVGFDGFVVKEGSSFGNPAMWHNHGFREILVARKDRVGEIIEGKDAKFVLGRNKKRFYAAAFKVLRCGKYTVRGEVYLDQHEYIDCSGYDKDSYDYGGDGWILKPLLEKYTVHAWDENGEPYKYSFQGEPDLDRIYKETIGEGALASWIRDDWYYVFASTSILDAVTPRIVQQKHNKFSADIWVKNNVATKLQQAIKEYVAAKQPKEERVCEKCEFAQTHVLAEPCDSCTDVDWETNDRPNFKPKSKSKENNKWTRTIGGLRVRTYYLEDGAILTKWSNGHDGIIRTPLGIAVKRAWLTHNNIPIKPYKEGDKMEAPE